MKPIFSNFKRRNRLLSAKRRPVEETRILVVGLNPAGLKLARNAVTSGYQVTAYDPDTDQVARLRRRQRSMAAAQNERFKKQQQIQFVADPQLLTKTDVFIVSASIMPDQSQKRQLASLMRSCELVANHLKSDALVVVSSTVPPGTSEEKIIPLLQQRSQLEVETDFDFAFTPEHISPQGRNNLHSPAVHIFGGLSKESTERAADLYRNVFDSSTLIAGSIKDAEATPLVIGALHDINLAFVNELAMAFEREGIDIKNVIENANIFTNLGASLLDPGYPNDHDLAQQHLSQLIECGERQGYTHRLLKAARSINQQLPFYTLRLLHRACCERGKDLTTMKVALIGYERSSSSHSYKTPTEVIRDELTACGATVEIFDPTKHSNDSSHALEKTLTNASAAILTIENEQLTKLRPSDFLQFGTVIVIDGRNTLNKEVFSRSPLTYFGIGR